MARLIYSESAFEDLERMFDFYSDADSELSAEIIPLIEEAIGALARHPLIGRSVESGLQELTISHGRTGFVALYDFVPEYDVVRVLALRHQREAGYPGGGGTGEGNSSRGWSGPPRSSTSAPPGVPATAAASTAPAIPTAREDVVPAS